MYKIAVWSEPQSDGSLQEYEFTVPSKWVICETVYWPNHLHAKRSFQRLEDPVESWLSYDLVKIKCTGEKLLL